MLEIITLIAALLLITAVYFTVKGIIHAIRTVLALVYRLPDYAAYHSFEVARYTIMAGLTFITFLYIGGWI